MRKECAGCGAILPDDVLACPICGEDKFIEAASAPQLPKAAKGQPPASLRKKAVEDLPSSAFPAEPPSPSSASTDIDPARQVALEQFFMDTITQLIIGGTSVEPKPPVSILQNEPLLPEMQSAQKLVLHEIILFKDDRTELVRKVYGQEGCSGIEVMRIRDYLGTSDYRPGKFLFIDPDHNFAVYGSTNLIFALKVSGSLHPQSEFVVKKVAEVGDTRISTQSQDANDDHLKHMLEKLCDALYSALVKLSG